MKRCLPLIAAGLLTAASPTAWEMTTYQDFVKGRFENIALSRDGRLTLAPQLVTLFSSDEAAVWCAAEDKDGTIYLGTGHRGKLYRVDRKDKSEVVFSSGEAEIFAIAFDARGVLYAATSPQGKIYRIEQGKAAEYFAPGSEYIWALAMGRDGTLYAGTGGEGKVYRISGPGQGEVYYETGQSHVTSLAIDRDGNLLAGSEPNGILYRITAKDKAFVLHDSMLPEIRSLAVAGDGTIYAAAMGGSIAKQITTPAGTKPSVTSSITVSSTATSITVTDEAAQQGGIQPKPATGTQPATQPQPAAAPVTTVVEYPGVEKSAIYKIRPDNTVETLWSSTEENAYDVALSGSDILIATDNQGRVYRLDDRRRTTLIVETRDNEVLRLLPSKNGTIVVTGNQGRLHRLSAARAQRGEFESTVHDASAAARWGRLSWGQSLCQGCKVSFRTRTGNSARPDRTWTDWSAPLTDSQGSLIPNPNARYVQWKVELQGAGETGPGLQWVRLAYLPRNTTPELRSLTVSAQTASAGATAAGAAANAAAPTYSITVTDSGDAGAATTAGTATQSLVRASREQILLSWLGQDADGDKLTYTIHFRQESDSEWTLLKDNLTESTYTLDAEALADGRYLFRVTASDRLVNPSGDVRHAELTSAPVLVDRTPPVVTIATPLRRGQTWEIRVEAIDQSSPLKACEYSVDAGPWMPLSASDGVLDSASESFLVQIPGTEGRLVVVRARDSAENAGLGRVVLR
jgi:hypothetical protein